MLSKPIRHRHFLNSRIPKLVLLCSMLIIVPGHYLPAQTLSNDRVIIRNYGQEVRAPNVIDDFSFDDQGTIWFVCPSDNIRSFDGTRTRVLETPVVKGNPIIKFAGITKDGNNRLLFMSWSRRLLFRIGKSGQLYLDSSLCAYNLPPYDNYHYFNWNWFVTHGSSTGINKERLALKNSVFTNSSFFPFNDSTFLYTENKISHLYKDNRQCVVNNSRVTGASTVAVNNELVLVEKNRFVFVDEHNWQEQEITLTGDILADTAYRNALHKTAAGLPFTLYHSEYPHIVCNKRLYRIQVMGNTRFNTIFVCDLSFLHYPINKVAYGPLRNITAIGTQREGLLIIRPNPFYTRRFSGPFEKLRTERIFYPLTLKDKNLFLTPWSEFSGNGYAKILDASRPGSQGLFVDHTGNVWECIDNKIIRYNHNMVKQGKAIIPAPNRKANDFCENDRGELFCLTERTVLKYENGVFKDTRAISSSDVTFAYFQMFRYIKNGLFWISSAKGVYVYNEPGNRIDKIDSIPDVFTFNITKLKDSAILFSCLNKDYFYYYYKDRFYRIYTSDNPDLQEIVSITEDQRGRVWLATNQGLYVTSAEELRAFCEGRGKSVYYYKYDKGDGLPVLEFNGGLNPSNAISADGYLALSSIAGVLLFHQDSISPLFPDGDILLSTQLKTGGSVMLDHALALKNENEAVIIQVSVPYYGSRRNLKLEYRIDDVMDAWTEVSDNGQVSIGPLPHGAYLLSVRVRTGLGPLDYATRQINISVPPLFYQTVAFKIILAIILLLVCTLAVFTIVRQRKEIRIKSASLRDKNAALGQMVMELRENIGLREKMISLIMHDLKSPLYFQSLILTQISAENYFTSREGRDLFLELKNSSATIMKFTNDFLAWYSSHKDGFTVKKTAFEHTLLIGELFNAYADIAARKKLALVCENTAPVLLVTDRNILEIILRNLLDNAIKYTQSGSVTLHFEHRDGGSIITVTDTGQGMPPGKIALLEAYAKKSHHQLSETFGYRFIYTLAEKIGATIQITSALDKGTSIHISIIP